MVKIEEIHILTSITKVNKHPTCPEATKQKLEKDRRNALKSVRFISIFSITLNDSFELKSNGQTAIFVWEHSVKFHFSCLACKWSIISAWTNSTLIWQNFVSTIVSCCNVDKKNVFNQTSDDQTSDDQTNAFKSFFLHNNLLGFEKVKLVSH